MIKSSNKTVKTTNINKMSSASDLSLAGSILQQLTSSSQSSSSLSSINSQLKSQAKSSFRLSTVSKLESDQILSSSSNYIIQEGGQVALAEAELDEIDDMIDGMSSVANLPIDDVEYMDNEVSSYSNTSSSPKHQERQIKQPTENSTQVATDSKALSNSPVDKSNIHQQQLTQPSKLNNMKMNLLSNQLCSISASLLTSNQALQVNCSTVLLPEEKVSNEAKEYWATIDLYNNSKIAFNKRLKSVKLKREKINAELNNRNQLKQSSICLKSNDNHHIQSSDPSYVSTEPCTCVKCSIVYHESLIKGVVSSSNDKITPSSSTATTTSSSCSKCKNSINCKCCLVSSSSPTSSSTVSSSSTNNDRANEIENKNELKAKSKNLDSNKKSTSFKDFDQFEEKLFNIKNELVNLSETSLDVFQLLLQLSDTMLDINTQLNNSQSTTTYSQSMNSNQLFCLNSFLGPETSNFLYEEEEGEVEDDVLIESVNESVDTEKLSLETKKFESPPVSTSHSTINTHKTNAIEEFLSKTLHTSQSLRINQQTNTNSVSNIINCFNSKHSVKNGSYFSTPSQSFRSPLSKTNKQFNKPFHLKQLQLNSKIASESSSSSSSSSPSSVANLIENIYDKTSVTQFVDSLLNHNTTTTNKTRSITSIDETSNISDCGFSTLSSANNEPVYQSIDPDFLNKSKKISTSTTNQILTRQFVTPARAVVLKKANSSRETTFTSMKTSKSNSSTTSSNSSSGATSMCSSSNNDLTSYSTPDNHTNRNSISSTVSSVLASPMSCLSSSSSNHETLTLQNNIKQYDHIQSFNTSETNSILSSTTNTYKRSNSVNYKSINQTTNSIANRKPSFKFESNILNKVQFMNMNKSEKMQPLNETKISPTNHETTLTLDHSKRSSLGREETYEHKQLIRRQQSTNSNRSYNQHQAKKLNLSAKLPSAQSIMINQIKVNQHQMSLDSGIFLPSENEEYNSFNINLVR